MTKLAYLIGKMEGFGKPGAVPTRNLNPGDLRHGNHIEKWDNSGIGIEPTIEDGWADLDHQIHKDAARGLTLSQFIAKYAPPTENNTSTYLKFVSDGLGVHPETPLSQILNISA